MKKLFILVSFISLFGGMQIANGQAVEQGNMLVDGFYGFPNLLTAALRTSYANGTTVDGIKIGGFGPVGGRFEYLLSDKVGIGLEYNMANSYVKYTETPSTTTYNYEVSASRMRIFPRFNFHFSNNEKLDAYFSAGAGYYKVKYKFESNDPNYTEESVDGIIPFTVRAAVGVRYFFTENIGLSGEFGLGGVLATGGVSFKF